MHRLAFACLLEAVGHGFNFHVGHLHRGDVVAMDELQHRQKLNEPFLYLQASVLMNE